MPRIKSLSLEVTENLSAKTIFSKCSESCNIGQHQVWFTGFCWSSPDISVCQV